MDELKKLMAEATNRPWKLSFHENRGECDITTIGQADKYDDREYGVAVTFDGPGIAADGEDATAYANAALIVAAVNALPELVALREENAMLRGAIVDLAKLANQINRAALNQEPKP